MSRESNRYLDFYCETCEAFRDYGLTTIQVELTDMPITLTKDDTVRLDEDIQNFLNRWEYKVAAVEFIRCDECSGNMIVRDRRKGAVHET